MSLSKASVSFGFAALLALAAMSASAQAERNPEAKRASCDTYAKMAEVQTEANEKYNCNYRGPEWTTSRRTHFDWCMVNRRDYLVDQIRYRAGELQRCFNNLGDYDDDNYDRGYERRFRDELK